MRRIRTILIPTDFGQASRAALSYAETIAGRFGARLHLLHVVAPAPFVSDVLGAESLALQIEQLLQQAERVAKRKLDRVPVEPASAARVTRTTVVGSPVETILRFITSKHVDLVVMGTHGRGAIQHVLLGSVAERIVRHSRAPVLTVHGHGRSARAPRA